MHPPLVSLGRGGSRSAFCSSWVSLVPDHEEFGVQLVGHPTCTKCVVETQQHNFKRNQSWQTTDLYTVLCMGQIEKTMK